MSMPGLGRTLAEALQNARFDIYEELDSTKEEARRRAGESSNPGWILALKQTEGRGRRGRSWIAPAGNLSLTGYAFHDGPFSQLPLLSFVAALAAFDTASLLSPSEFGADGLSLKWPNDLLLDGRKLAGLLLESGRGFDGLDWVSFSIGMNLANAPETTDIGQAAACLGERGAPPSAEQAARQFVASLTQRLMDMEEMGFEGIKRIWLNRATGIGREIRVIQGTETQIGVFEGLDYDGSLLLRAGDGSLVRIAAGDVFFGGQ